jgi:hypothetical protein
VGFFLFLGVEQLKLSSTQLTVLAIYKIKTNQNQSKPNDIKPLLIPFYFDRSIDSLKNLQEKKKKKKMSTITITLKSLQGLGASSYYCIAGIDNDTVNTSTKKGPNPQFNEEFSYFAKVKKNIL